MNSAPTPLKRLRPHFVQVASRLGLALLLVIAALASWSGQEYIEAATWKAHSDEVVSQLRALHVQTVSAESAQRGYILTKDSDFLKTYEKYKEEVFQDLEKLRESVRDNPAQSVSIDPLKNMIMQKFAFMEGTSSAFGSDQTKEFQKRVDSGQGPLLMDHIRVALKDFENREIALAETRSTEARETFRRATGLVLGGLLVSFLLLFLNNRLLLREIEARRSVEAELVEAKTKALGASDMKSRFLANMSHEIRTPLNGIIGMSKLLEQTELDERQRDFVETVKNSSISLLALINEVLDLSKIESGKLQLEETHFELGSLLKSTISIVEFSARAKGLQIQVDVAPEVPDFLTGDPLRIRQVLLNLMNNAIKFSDHGAISLRIRKKAEEDSRITLNFEVVDQGVGMDAETRAKLFQVFTQGDESTSRRYGGSGLGLAIAKQIVEMMDGHIDVESIKGAGSRFFFDIKLKAAKFDESSRPVTFEKMALKNLHGSVLIAEDNKVNQKVVIEMMKYLGCRTRVVENGKLALEALQKEEFQLILMDGQMPEMDGYEATRQIRAGAAGEKNRRVPIIATTANAIKGDIERCLEAGMNDYVSKPISYDDLAFKVEKWITRGHNALDAASIAKLKQLGKNSSKDLFKELATLFVEETPRYLAEIRAALEKGDRGSSAKGAHALKSSSANLGALRMRELCERLERAKPDQETRYLLLLVQNLDDEFEVVKKELEVKLSV